jgi:hypothetical protein
MLINNKTFFLFIHSLAGGGAEGVCVTIANYLIERGFHVVLIMVNLDNAVRKNELDQKIKLIILDKKNVRTLVFPLFFC